MKKELIKPVTILYRSNDIFDTHVPPLADHLSTIGDTQVHVFETETPSYEISSWHKEHYDELRGRKILSDNTSRPHYNLKLDVEGKLDLMTTEAFFAEFKKQVPTKMFRGNTHDTEPEGNLETIAEVYTKTFEKLLKNKQPKNVNIALKNLGDHFPSIKGYGYGSEKEAKAAELLTGYLQQAGIPKERIHTHQYPQETDMNTWTLIDRHNIAYEETKGLRLGLPFADMFTDISNHGLLTLDEDAVNRSIISHANFRLVNNLSLEDIQPYLTDNYKRVGWQLTSKREEPRGGILYKQAAGPKEIERIAEHYTGLVLAEKNMCTEDTRYLFKVLFEVLAHEDVSEKLTRNATREVLESRGMEYLQEQLNNSLLTKLQPKHFPELNGYEYHQSAGWSRGYQKFEKYRIQEAENGLERTKISEQAFWKDKEGNIKKGGL